jgi:hypothetical protein
LSTAGVLPNLHAENDYTPKEDPEIQHELELELEALQLRLGAGLRKIPGLLGIENRRQSLQCERRILHKPIVTALSMLFIDIRCFISATASRSSEWRLALVTSICSETLISDSDEISEPIL